jgi:rRNA-processing protein FCF1
MKVLLDTNFMLLPSRHKIDIYTEIKRLVPEEHTLATLSSAVKELRQLEGLTRDGLAAKVGLALLENKKVEILPSEGFVDDALVKYASENKSIVCTNDRELKRRLRKAKAGIIYMRGKNHLERV